ncbi:hypothetical protein LMJF_31_2160 [Leishmania major strain Friedlin]|uniref:Uncharacterized protein n=1 Tax=Leishmania major TaxID=5664 RepID=Q4Q645_LEIMA|nr:hypothetical protein LMJF_31_2160 [Leishmania major strain Friedlin]CAG9579392.1 hypothetical_protein_-_conserved [Leishmania major strain Friedlin]CAJ08405.1 hypothetical protein LMJF_31_2160 [Leishmania major strain Friedlin]|eukprot:XP_001685203.1 hypothetical protein LMJF_31_2160 [Leishmania major strain Friedlin]
MKTKPKHSKEESASPYFGATSVPLHSRDEAPSKRRTNSTPRSPQLKRSSSKSGRLAVDAKATTKVNAACGRARQRPNQNSGKLDARKKSASSSSRRESGKVATALRRSRPQEAPVNSDDDAPSSTGQLYESIGASPSAVALQSQTSDGEYFLPDWSVSSEAPPAIHRTGFPLNRPSSELRRNLLNANSSSDAVPHTTDRTLREHMDMSSSWTPQSQKPLLWGISPKAAPKHPKDSSATPSTVRCYSQYHMASSTSSSLLFGAPYQVQQQRKAARTAPSDLNPENFYPPILMRPPSDRHQRTEDSCNASRQLRSRFDVANGDVAATSGKRGDFLKLCGGSITWLNDSRADDISPLAAQRSSRAVDAGSLGTLSSAFFSTTSRSPPQSLFRVPMSMSPCATPRNTRNGFDRGSVVWKFVYGTDKDGDDEESPLASGRHWTGAAGRRGTGGLYQSPFHSATGPLPLSESDPNGGEAGADERPAQRHGNVSSLYGCMLDGAALVSSSSSDDGVGADEDHDYRISSSTRPGQRCTLESKRAMSVLAWMMKTGKSRLCGKGGGTRGGSDNDDEDSEDAERRQRFSPTSASKREGCGATAHRSDVDSHRSEVVVRNDTGSDESADAEGDSEGNPTSPSRQTVLQRILSGMGKPSDPKEVDEEVAVQEERSTPRIAPSLPSRSGAGRGSRNAHQRVIPAVADCKRPVSVHYYGSPRANMTPPAGYQGWCAGYGAQAAAYLHSRCIYQPLSRSPSPQNENGWNAQLAEFISPSTHIGCGAYASPAPHTVPVACRSLPLMFRQTVTTMAVHELLGLDPEAEIIFVKSPVWKHLPR